MTIEHALWMQGDGLGGVTYPARLDRQLIDSIFTEGILGSGSFAVTQRGAGANFSVDVAAGVAVVEGDDQANQGKYVVQSTVTENVVVPAAPGSNSRIDLVVVRVNDADAGGDITNDVTLAVVAGTAAASPVAPALPPSALLLATLLVTSSHVAIETADITDSRVLARLTYEVVDTTELADSAVTTAKINDDAVTQPKIGPGAVGTTEIASDAVTQPKIGPGAVGTTEIANDAVTDAKIGSPTVGSLDGGLIRYARYGNIVHVWSDDFVPSAPNSVFMPVGFRPANGGASCAGIQNDSNPAAVAINGSTGEISATWNAGNVQAKFSMSYSTI